MKTGIDEDLGWGVSALIQVANAPKCAGEILLKISGWRKKCHFKTVAFVVM